jgi:hypothetical protein
LLQSVDAFQYRTLITAHSQSQEFSDRLGAWMSQIDLLREVDTSCGVVRLLVPGEDMNAALRELHRACMEELRRAAGERGVPDRLFAAVNRVEALGREALG